MQHSSRAFPVIHIDGLSFNVRRRGGGTFGDLAAAYMSEISLPQNYTASKGVNHENRPAAVAAVLDTSGAVRVGAVPRREGTGR